MRMPLLSKSHHHHHHLRPTWKSCILVFLLCLVVYFLYTAYNPLANWYRPDADSSHTKTLFRSSLSERERRAFLETFGAFDAALRGANVSYFAIGGTLLGAFRHHGLIPWDDDADVVLPWSQSVEAFRALAMFDPGKFGIYAGLGVSLSSFLWRDDSATAGDVNLRFATKSFQWKFYPLSGSKVLLWPYRFPYIDIFFYEENSTHLLTTSSSFPEVYDKRLVFPLVRRPFNDIRVPTPCRIESFLRSLNVDATACVSKSFNHRIDIPLISSAVNIPCSSLARDFPFVNRTTVARREANGSEASAVTKETLLLGGKVLGEFLAPPLC